MENPFSDSINKSDTLKSKQIPHTFLPVGALVSYYFWEEDSLGYIVNNKVEKPFLQNYYIEKQLIDKPKDTVDVAKLSTMINLFAHEIFNKHTSQIEKKHTELLINSKKQRIYFPLIRNEALDKGSMLYIKQRNEWISKKRKSVIYFNISSDQKMKYYYSSDTIVLYKHKVSVPSNGQYIVFTYFKSPKKIDYQEVYTYSGENVTDFFIHANEYEMQPQRVIVFANGYRGPTRDKDETDHLVTQKDRYYYWFKIDNQFIDRLKPSASYYIDGSMGIYTSNHRTMAGFAVSMFRSSFVLRKRRTKKNFKSLNTQSNIEGFEIRKEKGRIAGKAFLSALCNSPVCQGTIDTVDIVCHSMGYAYSLGFIEEIKDKVIFGNMYVLAPENACVDSVDWKMFQHVWQYGSNLDQKNPDPVWEQDGIAPQCQVKGLECLPQDRAGRAFIPKNWPRKNFVDSHQLYNFDWIFECITLGDPGFITR